MHNSCNVYLAHAIDEPPEMLGDHVPGEVVPANSKQDSISMVSIYYTFFYLI